MAIRLSPGEVRALSQNPELRFAEIEHLALQKLENDIAEDHNGNPVRIHDDRDYMMTVLAAAKQSAIDDLLDERIPHPSEQDADEVCEMFRVKASLVSQEIMFRYAHKSSTVSLDIDTKNQIKGWLDKMREAVQASSVEPHKKGRLLHLINGMQAEVDRELTPRHALGELFVTICGYGGAGAEAMRPLAEFAMKIGRAMGIAVESEDAGPTLPPPQKPKQVAPPKQSKMAKRYGGYDKPLDDEIPF